MIYAWDFFLGKICNSCIQIGSWEIKIEEP